MDSQAPVLYGTVTTGDTWKLGLLHRADRAIHKDINTYPIPSDLSCMLSFLFGISLGMS